jgi:hypothetical protein
MTLACTGLQFGWQMLRGFSQCVLQADEIARARRLG